MISMERRRDCSAVLHAMLTEESTDVLKNAVSDSIKPKLPRWMRWLPIGRVLDKLLPEMLLELIDEKVLRV